jgi:hypothetical protein
VAIYCGYNQKKLGSKSETPSTSKKKLAVQSKTVAEQVEYGKSTAKQTKVQMEYGKRQPEYRCITGAGQLTYRSILSFFSLREDVMCLFQMK